ncbi:MAG: ABC transporter ATP-binding protein [Planctomycetes bacterium]|nr:ABC transporter ATP-binding protein [Planctomycetota bacterium]
MILRNISLTVEEGETLAIVGPSGCGKTTVLRLISGLLQPSSGRALVFGEHASNYAPRDRCVATVWQTRALFPHMSARGNIEFGLRVRRVDRSERKRRVMIVAERLRLAGLLDREVVTLSGGEQQRVAVARAMIVEPRILLLDEPFTALDQSLKIGLQNDLRELMGSGDRTYVLVSHDFDDVLSLANRVAVLHGGSVVQVDEPRSVWMTPNRAVVAEFVGRSNVVVGTLVTREDEMYATVETGFGRVEGRMHTSDPASLAVGSRVAYVLHPHHIRIGRDGERTVDAVVDGVMAHELHDTYVFRLSDGTRLRAAFSRSSTRTGGSLCLGTKTRLAWDRENALVVPP